MLGKVCIKHYSLGYMLSCHLFMGPAPVVTAQMNMHIAYTSCIQVSDQVTNKHVKLLSWLSRRGTEQSKAGLQKTHDPAAAHPSVAH